MAYNPGVSFFIPFHELDPSKERQCIFFTQKGARCQWGCQQSDNRRAIVLHETINAISSEAVDLDLLQEYVLCNCCRSGRARHRDRIEDIGLLIPLAQRWQDEIRRHADHTTSVLALEGSVSTPYAHTQATPSPSDTTTLYIPIESPIYDQLNAPKSSRINATPSKPAASLSYSPYGSSGISATTEFGFQPFETKSRYDLRPREANISTNSISTQPKSISQLPQSEFRPHVADPLRSDSVSWKILDPLEDRDFETGSVYIFDRASSPGHVKIGWTAKSVSRRLTDWSKCGYEPNLLFEVHSVPYAQRVETLTHHELIKEWRRERMCKAPSCGKSHQEWFEINKEQAEQVLGNWADLMKKAEPYDLKGRLKSWWKEAVETMDGNGEVVTAKKLLECYEESLVDEATLVEEAANLGHELKIEEEVGFGNRPKVERLETLEETPVRVGPLWIEKPTLPKETPLLKSEPVHEDVLASQTTPVKKELPLEQTPLPPSPLLQPTIVSQNTLPSQGTTPNPSPGMEEASAINTITSSDTNITAVNTSPNPKTDLLVSPSAPAPLSAATSPSATPNKAISPQTNANISTDTSTSTTPPLLNFSDASSGPNPLDPSATSAPPRAKAKSVPSPIMPPSTEATEALLSLSTDEQEGLVETLDSITQRQQNIEENRQAEPESNLFGCDGQPCENEIRSPGQDQSTATEEDTETGANGWDAELTLVEDQISGSLEKVALKIVDELSNEISTRSANSGLKSLGVLNTLESEAPPAIGAVAQA